MLKVQFAIAFILICMLPVVHAGNEGQPGENWELAGSQQREAASTSGLSLNLKPSWRQDLEKSGALSRTGPYRVALPLASLGGNNGPKLVVTYLPRAREGLGADRSVMIFLRINLD
ncbi:MAG: hypothetical protein ACJ8G3_09460 [Burkholderiaceae bacterium]